MAGKRKVRRTSTSRRRRQTIARRHYVWPIIIVVISLALTATAVVFLRGWEEQNAHEHFVLQADLRLSLIRSAVAVAEESVEDVGALFDSLGIVERTVFDRFAKKELEHSSGVQALEWIPLVTAAQRAEFTRAAREQGFPAFTITERDAQGQTVPAGRRDTYFPVYYLYPLKGNERAVGFDLGSNPVRLKAMQAARDSGRATATSRITLVQGSGQQYGFLTFLPVYVTGARLDSVADRRKHLRGYALAVFSVGDLVNSALSKAPLRRDIRTYVFDMTAPPGERLLFPKGASVSRPASLALDRCSNSQIPIGGRRWLVALCPAEGAFVPSRWLSSATAVVGLLITAFLFGYLAILVRERARALKAKNKARASEARYRDIVDDGHILVQSIDPETGRFVFVNQAWTESLGYTQAQARRVQMQEIIHPDSLDHCMAVFAQAMRGEEAPVLQAQLVAKDGGTVDIEGRVVARTAEDGKTMTHGIFADVTARKAAQKEHEVLRRRLENAIDAMPDGFVIYDRDDRLVICNEGYKRMYEESADLLVPGTRFEDILRDGIKRGQYKIPKGQEKKWLRQRLKRHRDAGGQIEQRLADGKWVLIQERVTDEGDRVGVRIDITQQKETEQKLIRLAEDRDAEANELIQLIDTANAPIFGIDTKGRINEWNQKVAELTGYEKAHVLDCDPVDEFVVEDHKKSVRKVLNDALDGKPTANFEFHLTTRRGTELLLLLNATPRRNSAGKIVGVIGIGQDLTETRRKEAELQQAQKLEAVGQLSGGIAHDFNNLLTVIRGNLQLLQEEVSGDGETDELIADAISAATDGADLTRRLLAFSRKQALDPKTLDANTLVRNFANLLRRTLGKTIEMKLELSPEDMAIVADPAPLENSLLNLALNARDAMGEAGTLTIATEPLSIEPGEGEERDGLAPGRYIALSVTDTGEGIPPDIIPRVIEPFFTTKTSGEGSGLGLSMVHGFVKQSGGAMRIESTLGTGTTVTLLLPSAEGAIAESTEDDADVALPTGSESILVAEDETRVRRFAVRCLKSLGYQIIEAKNATQAIALLEERDDIDMVFSDIIMPGGINGRDLAALVSKSWPEVAVRLTTGFSKSQGRAETETDAEIPEHLLRKPYTKQQLAFYVRAALDGTVAEAAD